MRWRKEVEVDKGVISPADAESLPRRSEPSSAVHLHHAPPSNANTAVHLHLFSPPLLLAATLVVQPLAEPDVLEPSVLNEVEHALAVAPTNAIPATAYVFTNGVTATDRAIRLVSTQKSDGRWYAGTNDVTAAAIRELRRLAGLPDDKVK